MLVVRREGANRTHCDFRVRRQVVHRALQWLVTHNQYYRSMGITIDYTALEQLPQDGNVSEFVCITEDCSTPATITDIDTTPTSEAAELEDDHLSHSFVPVSAPSITEQEAVQQSVDQRQSTSSSHQPLMWPSIGGMPLK